MQILVLGMHRSGTSAVVRLLNMMGAYLGPPERIKGANPENPKGFWENDDLVELDNAVLGAQRCLWDRLGEYDRARLDDERLDTLRRRAKDFVIGLDASRPWAVKDPRMCLLLPFWRPLLERPLCVLVNRNPLEVAKSLKARNGIPLNAGIAMWELHNVEALRGTIGVPRILIQYADVIGDPVGSTRRLLDWLIGMGVRKLDCPSNEEITTFIDPNLHRQRATRDEAEGWLTPSRRRLCRALDDGSAIDWTDVPELSDAGRETLLAYDAILHARNSANHLKGIVTERERELREARAVIAKLTEARERLEAELRNASGPAEDSAKLAAQINELSTRVSVLEQSLGGGRQSSRTDDESQ